ATQRRWRHRQACWYWQRASTSLFRGLRQFRARFAPGHGGPESFRDRKAGAQTVFVKSIAGPGAAEPGMAAALNLAEPLLPGKGGGVILRMLNHVLAEGKLRIGLEQRVEADEQRLVVVDALQRVHPIGHGD